MQQEKNQKQIDPMLSFHLMKFAFQDFQKSASNLTEKEYNQAYQHANEEMLLHQVILNSDDACCVVIPQVTLQQTLRGVIAEYPDDTAFHNTLEENQLGLEEYTMALHNDLRVETVLSRVASSAQCVSAQEVRAYFKSHRSEFNKPERRSARHIHIRFNPAKASDMAAAFSKITAIHHSVLREPQNFGNKAKQFSDCSTRDDNGRLGLRTAGELCQELDQALFSLQQGEISAIIRGQAGFDIMVCDTIFPPQQIGLKEATPSITATLMKKKQLEACRLWLQSLVQPE
jgi:nitrogen fixation protein NifM